jgi:serine/threonine-protein kinase PpkA
MMSPNAALELVEVIGSCLDFLHRGGIIHRVIKPANILFRNGGTSVLTDFGIAKQLDQDIRLTLDSTALGSPCYLSPEQAECKPLDGRTDIYSLGIILYEMQTGRKPFQGDSPIETILAHLTDVVRIYSPNARLPLFQVEV